MKNAYFTQAIAVKYAFYMPYSIQPIAVRDVDRSGDAPERQVSGSDPLRDARTAVSRMGNGRSFCSRYFI
jgi:hypothetical protein